MKKTLKYLLLTPTLLLPSFFLVNSIKEPLTWSTNTELQSDEPIFYGKNLDSALEDELSLKIVNMQHPNEIRVNPITSNLCEINLIPKFSNKKFQRKPLTIQATENTSNYSISSIDDTNYEEPLEPLKSGLKRRVTSAPILQDDLRILERVYLKFPYELEDNHHYTITLNKNLVGSTKTLKFTYKKNRISTAIHIDPEGYLPTDKKIAYLGMQLGSIGELVTEELSFSVRNLENNETVYSGKGTIQNSSGWRENFKNLDTLYKHVVAFDFSEVKEEGEYVIETPNSGISQPIVINNDAYRKTLNTLALGLYNQRRGEDITLPYSRHERLATIENHTYIYDSNDLDPFVKNNPKFNGIKYPTTNEGKQVSFEAAGHMDAGDYSIYTYNSSMFTWQLLVALDTFGEKLSHDNLGIPESGDDIPDMYQEMMIDLKWLMGMQDDDGGVFGISKPKGESYQSKMTGVDENLERYLTPKDTPHTASFTATMARAARSKSIETYNPELQETLKEKALNAWRWLEENEGIDGWHHYGKREADKDDRVWAAIELYALTGEKKFHDYFVAHHQPELRDNGVHQFNHGYGFANRVVALWDTEKVPFSLDETMKDRCIKKYKYILDHYLWLSTLTPYNILLEGAEKRWNQLGWYFPVYQYGYDLVLGHYLYKDERYLDLAKDQLHFSLGANPSNKSSITGLGNKRIQSLVDQKSRFDNIAQPVNGLPVSPIISGSSWLNNYERALFDYTYPRTTYDFSPAMAYGMLDETYDGWNVSAEFTIEKLGAMLVVLGYLTEVDDQTYDYPEFNLTLETLDNGQFKPHLNFKNSPERAKVVWFANDVAVSIDPNFILKQDFTIPTYKLGAEIVDNNGRRWFSETLVNTRDYANDKIPLKEFNSMSYANIWHFNDDLKSDKDTSLEFTGNTYFDDSNLFWMKEEKGKALRVNGKGDGVRTSLSADKFLEGKSLSDVGDITVEALIYPESFAKPENIGEMIKFEQSWGSELQLVRFGWENVVKTRLSKEILGDEGNISKALTLNQWHYVKMKIDKKRLYLSIDGIEIYNKERDEEAAIVLDHRDIHLYLGDFYGWIDEFKITINEDEARVPIEPFKSEKHTQIWHFDDNLHSDKGVNLNFKNNAYLDNSNLSWMKEEHGHALHVNGEGDGVETLLPADELLEGRDSHDVNAITVEAVIYPESFVKREELGEMIKFDQSWGSELQLVHFRWEKVLKTRLSKEILGDEGNINKALTLNQWHYVKMKIDKKRLYFSIDGIEIYNKLRDEEVKTLLDYRDITLYLGDFNGWIDEFRVKLEMKES